MPSKTPNPASLVKLSSGTKPNEKNKPRQKAKEKQISVASINQPQRSDPSVENDGELNRKKLPSMNVSEKRFDVTVDGVPYLVRSIPFLWNDNVCFRVHINGNEAPIFSRVEDTGTFAAIDDAASILPEGVEQAIRERIVK